MTKLKIKQAKQAEEALNKIVNNLLDYTDEVVNQIKPLAKDGVININEWNTFSIIDMAYMVNHNERVFGSFDKDFIYELFNKGVLTNDLKKDIDKSIYMQLWQSTL
jgi:hypothetical protein